jgi:hypothetical protein
VLTWESDGSEDYDVSGDEGSIYLLFEPKKVSINISGTALRSGQAACGTARGWMGCGGWGRGGSVTRVAGVAKNRMTLTGDDRGQGAVPGPSAAASVCLEMRCPDRQR